ncbi:MAG: preprotein translocase subunit SecE [Saprospiraceae bacterium]|nr:preprotein translocase subunit SecE [Saprospiraceae bacterium]
MGRIRLYFIESYNELVNKVTWPSWKNLYSYTGLVVLASLIFSIFVFFMDLISKNSLVFIYGIS